MQDLRLLERRGLTPEKLKAKFVAPEAKKGGKGAVLDEKIQKLLALHQSRIKQALIQNMRDARTYWAIDQALEAAQRNMPIIQARSIWELRKNPEDAIKEIQALGLDRMLTPLKGTDGKPILAGMDGKQQQYALDLPIFDTVFVPLVMSYMKARWAKLWDDRNLYPFIKYSPRRLTTPDLLRTEIITNLVEQRVSEMGTRAVVRQAIGQALAYSYCLCFPQEDYHREKYLWLEGDKEVERVQREGVRLLTPRPERTFWDKEFPLTSLNSDTGVKWCGFWSLVRYGSILENKDWWNKEKVSWGQYPWFGNSAALNLWSVYATLYPCQLKWPSAMVSAQSNDRQTEAMLYTTQDNDAACTLVVLFDKLVPSEWGLGDYDYPVWMRFVYADIGTLLYCQPWGYTPAIAFPYDHDANRAMNASLAMELAPFQTAIGNYLTQHLISVKQNLPRIVFYNTDIVDKAHVDQIKGEREALYQQINFVPFSKRQFAAQGSDANEAFHGVSFPQANTSETAQAVSTLLSVLERMLGFSSQEVGAPAVHEETAHEVSIKANNSTIRIDFTGSFVDDGVDALKRMLYEAVICYAGETVVAEAADLDDEERKKALEGLGFKVKDATANKNNRFGVEGPKTALMMDGFSADREGPDRVNDQKVAIAMMQMFGVLVGNPAIFQAVGAQQVISLANRIMQWSGLPEDYRWRISAQAAKALEQGQPDQARQQLSQALQEAAKQILGQAAQMIDARIKQVGQQVGAALRGQEQAIQQKVVAPLAQQLQQLSQALTESAQHNESQDAAIEKLSQMISGLAAALGQAAPSPAMPGPPPSEPPGMIHAPPPDLPA